METLNQYFSYNKDCSISDVFYQLYKQMKVIHDNGMIVPLVDSNHILFDGSFTFDDKSLSNNIELDKNENLLSLTKLFLGTYISFATGFRDFSSVDNEWFLQNMDSINNMITDDDFPSQYFSSVFVNGENGYYSDYVDKIKQSESLSSMSNVKGYKKVLSNAASKFYEDQSQTVESTDGVGKKTAFINFLFYPTLIISIILICFVVYTCFRYLGI